MDYTITPGKWDSTLALTSQTAHGQTLAIGVPGAKLPKGAADAGFGVDYPDLADHLQTLSAIVRRRLKESLSLQFEYRYEHYAQQNYKVDGLEPFMPMSNVSGNGVVRPSTDVFLGDQLNNYTAHAFALSALHRF